MTVAPAGNAATPRGRLSVESWSPDYGAPMEGTEGGDNGEGPAVDVGFEVPARAWEPRRPAPVEPATVAFVDGVRRIDATLAWDDDHGGFHAGIAASVAAGVVCCYPRAGDRAASAEITRVELDRVVLLTVPIDTITTRHGSWRHRPPSGRDDPGALSIELQQVMADLEVAVATAAAQDHGAEVTMVVVDGPIRRREKIPNALGHVKTHQHRYLPASVAAIIGQLEAGERTPVFAIGEPFPRLSWYLRLPGPRQHPWSGVVRHEIAPTDRAAATALADRAAATLGRFASNPARDPRAPQNLTPVGGLETQLRHRLGDAALLYRSLRHALNGGRTPAACAGHTEQ